MINNNHLVKREKESTSNKKTINKQSSIEHADRINKIINKKKREIAVKENVTKRAIKKSVKKPIKKASRRYKKEELGTYSSRLCLWKMLAQGQSEEWLRAHPKPEMTAEEQGFKRMEDYFLTIKKEKQTQIKQAQIKQDSKKDDKQIDDIQMDDKQTDDKQTDNALPLGSEESPKNYDASNNILLSNLSIEDQDLTLDNLLDEFIVEDYVYDQDDPYCNNDNNNYHISNNKDQHNDPNNHDDSNDNEAMDDTRFINRCMECGIDMGDCNPRQLCAKTYCENEFSLV